MILGTITSSPRARRFPRPHWTLSSLGPESCIVFLLPPPAALFHLEKGTLQQGVSAREAPLGRAWACHQGSSMARGVQASSFHPQDSLAALSMNEVSSVLQSLLFMLRCKLYFINCL